ncbi:MAG: hypothetical protein JO256_05325 [Alphaproteobacteria bacterium]|nr:hypothetical protein [Alphaproteobacteria bacterium]
MTSWKLGFCALLLTVFGLLAATAFATPVYAANAVAKAADRVSKDKWARTDPPAAKHASSSDDDDDDDSDSHDHDKKAEPKVISKHDGELNGKISIHGW